MFKLNLDLDDVLYHLIDRRVFAKYMATVRTAGNTCHLLEQL